MPRRRAEITKPEITRAVAAVIAAGVKVYGVRVDGGVLTILTEPSAAPATEARDASDVFNAWMKDQALGKD